MSRHLSAIYYPSCWARPPVGYCSASAKHKTGGKAAVVQHLFLLATSLTKSRRWWSRTKTFTLFFGMLYFFICALSTTWIKFYSFASDSLHLFPECSPPSFLFQYTSHKSAIPAPLKCLFLFACWTRKYWILLGHYVTICSRFHARKIKENQANSCDTSDICGAKAVCTVPEVIRR